MMTLSETKRIFDVHGLVVEKIEFVFCSFSRKIHFSFVFQHQKVTFNQEPLSDLFTLERDGLLLEKNNF